MTTPTPTAEFEGPLDLGALNALAGQFFAALPGTLPQRGGGVPLPSNPLPGGVALGPWGQGPQLAGTVVPGGNVAPQTPQAAGAVLAPRPATLPHAVAPNGLPDHAAIVPPALDGRFGGHSLGVPAGGGAPSPGPVPPQGVSGPLSAAGPVTGIDAAPQLAGPAPAAVPFGAPPSPPGGGPFYFLDHDAPPPAAGSDRITARSWALPGEAELRDLLTADPRLASARPRSDERFYFAPERASEAIPAVPQSAHPAFDVHAVRRDFPILQERVNGRPLVWFDNAATTQKPKAVIDRLACFYERENSNIHRAAHELAARATDAYEKARETVRAFINAPSADEVIFVRGTTEGINLVARTWGAKNLTEGDEIIVSHLEHHANIVPWQQIAARTGAKLRVIPVDDDGQVILSDYQRLITPRTKIVSVTQVSNALGTVVPVEEIVGIARRQGIATLVDGAQSVSHMATDVQRIGADFFVFSGHKIFGPTGIGVVWGRKEILDEIPAWQGGGNMIADVTFERTIYQPIPNKFEAGTGNIADAAGLGAALDYVRRVGIEAIARHEHDLLAYATHLLRPIRGVRLIGTAREKASVLSFVLDGYSTEEVGKALNQEGIAVRTGHHCAQPILRRFGLETTVRPSLAFYNTNEEVDRFIAVIRQLSTRSGR